MTVAFFISPGAFPAIAADYVITQHFDNVKRFSSKIGQELAGRGLINFEESSVRKNHYHSRYARKTYIIDDMTCVSFSGNSHSGHTIINEYLKLRQDNSVRPLRDLGNIIDRMNSTLFRGKESYFIGAHVKYIGDQFIVHDLSTPEMLEHTIGKFGKCNFTGSGAHDYIERLEKTSSQFFDGTLGDDKLSNFYFIANSLNKLCSETIFDDFFDGDTDHGFGGFIEYCFFNLYEKKWQRQLDTLYLFIELSGSIGNIVRNLTRPVVAYRSEPERSGILGLGPSNVSLQTLYDITSQNCVEEFQLGDWDGWKPKLVSIHFYTTNNGNPESLMIINRNSDLCSVRSNLDCFEVEVDFKFLDEETSIVIEMCQHYFA